MVLTIVIIYVIFLKPMLLSGQNKMVPSGYEPQSRVRRLYVLFNTFISLLKLTNFPDASLSPIKVY